MAGLDTPNGPINVPDVAPMSYVNATPPPVKSTTPVTPAKPVTPAAPGSYKGVPITPGTDAQVAAQVAAIDAKPQIVSSNSALDANANKTAMNNAGNALTGPTGTTTNNNTNNGSNNNTGSMPNGYSVDPTTKAAMDALTAGNTATQGLFANMQNALQMNYNAALAVSNAQYGALFQNLADSHASALGVAAQNAAALNPYSTAKGATTDVNFAGAINTKYQQQAAELTQQAQAAQQALEAGNFSDYVTLQGKMQDQQTSFTTGMTNILQNYQATQLAQAKQATDLAEFNQTEGDKAISQYTDSLSKVQLPTPEQLKGMSDDQLMALPAVQQGLAAGYTLAGIKTDLLSAAGLQAQNSAFKNAQTANETRLANAAGKTSAADTKQSSLAAISQQLVAGTTISATDDTPVLDSHGYITPQAWKTLEENAPSMGLSRDDLLSEFGYKLYVDKSGNPSSSYGVSPEEAKKYISGSSGS